MDPRLEHIVDTEVQFRAINQRLRDGMRAVADGAELIDFVCECGHRDCTASVSLTLPEYDAVRQSPERFAIRAGHQIEAAESVVDRRDCYWVIAKQGEGSAYARERDPRR